LVKIKMIGTPEIPLQHNMFTGVLVDNRNRRQKKLAKKSNQPRQRPMFSLKETVQLGVQARPWLNKLARPQMILEREDTRTDEEKERALLREAEVLTSSLFADTDGTSEAIVDQETPPETGNNNEAEPEVQVETPDDTQKPKSEAYLELVQIAKEYAMTIWLDATYRQKFYAQLPLAIINAQAAGLAASEITAAMQTGDIAGQQEKSKQNGKLPTQPNIRQSRRTRIEGHRLRARRARVNLRTRSHLKSSPISKSMRTTPTLNL
jgi:hypothetical protein